MYQVVCSDCTIAMQVLGRKCPKHNVEPVVTTTTTWPSPENIVLMSTKERNEMERYIAQWASGINMRHKLRETYKAGFMAGKPKEEFQIHDGKLPE